MPYRDFTIDRVRADFAITVETRWDLFRAVPPVPPEPATAEALRRNRGLAVAINTEKAKSELLIAPLLLDAWRRGADRLSFLSGVAFNVDPAAELTGVCDFVLGYPPQLDFVTSPVLMVTEAKNDSVMGGLGQCAAAMVAAQRFNQGRTPPVPTVYGCVTNGVEWKFLRLAGNLLEVDLSELVIADPAPILGVILHFLGLNPVPAAAA